MSSLKFKPSWYILENYMEEYLNGHIALNDEICITELSKSERNFYSFSL